MSNAVKMISILFAMVLLCPLFITGFLIALPVTVLYSGFDEGKDFVINSIYQYGRWLQGND